MGDSGMVEDVEQVPIGEAEAIAPETMPAEAAVATPAEQTAALESGEAEQAPSEQPVAEEAAVATPAEQTAALEGGEAEQAPSEQPVAEEGAVATLDKEPVPTDSEEAEEAPSEQPVAEEAAVATLDKEPVPTDSEEAKEAAQAVVDDGRSWYVVHSYSGYENKVKKNLEHRIESMNMQNKIFQVVVPTEEEIEIREGHRRRTKKRVFPGYILVQMILDEESWYVVRNTPGVTGFVSAGTKPAPLRQEEADKIFKRMEAEAPKIKISFREGQTVRIVDGPFVDFVGTVEDMDLDKGKVRVMVSFFGRETPVELDFLQVQRQ